MLDTLLDLLRIGLLYVLLLALAYSIAYALGRGWYNARLDYDREVFKRIIKKYRTLLPPKPGDQTDGQEESTPPQRRHHQ